MDLKEVAFDEQDKNLFQVRDSRLRADALRHSLLPRLHILHNEACAKIRKVYGVDVFEDSLVSWYPHFRTRREQELQHLYESAFVGLGGKRTKDRWHGLKRKDGKEPQIVPFRFAFVIDEDGIFIVLENNWAKGLTDDSYSKFLQFVIDHSGVVARLSMDTGIHPQLLCSPEVRPLAPIEAHYRLMIEDRYHDNHFLSRERPYPIGIHVLQELIDDYTLFYPVYDSYIQIARGAPIRFEALIDRANDWLESDLEADPGVTEFERSVAQNDPDIIAEVAGRRVPVMPAIRWQVFQRDEWKCVACGRTSHDGILLQVDHITPRSKGGSDSFDNLQTLCNECNSGKSNRDATDLRRAARDED